MTSKDALKLLYTDAENYAYFNETEEDLSEIKAEYELIKQDLDRYEYICNLLKRFIEKIELSSNIFPSNLYRLIIDLTEQELELLKEVIQ